MLLSTIYNRGIPVASSCLRQPRSPTIAISVRRDIVSHHATHRRSAKLQNFTNIKQYSSFATATAKNHNFFHPSLHSDHAVKHSIIRTNFNYAGPRKLSDVLKVEMFDDKSSSEISDMWMTYHEGKEKVHGLTVDKTKGGSILARAAQCPFFIHPVFREEGHFMILSQFQSPNFFLLAFLEDYRMDPARAQPLLTVSIFDDMADEKDVALVRCDIINRGIEDDEGYNITKQLLEDYADEDNFRDVHTFNKQPDAFDVDAFVKEKEKCWKS